MMEEKLDNIEKELNSIKEEVKKLNEKSPDKIWTGAMLAIITAILGGFGYFVEKEVDKSTVQEINALEVYGEEKAKEQIAFYKNVKTKINRIDNSFTEYCLISRDSITQKKLLDALHDFTTFIDDAIVEQEIVLDIKEYSEFVAEETFNIYSGQTHAEDLRTKYSLSKEILSNVDSLTDIRLEKLLGK